MDARELATGWARRRPRFGPDGQVVESRDDWRRADGEHASAWAWGR